MQTDKMSDKDVEHELEAASVNHSLPFEQVCNEWIEKYDIPQYLRSCLTAGKILD